MSEHDTRDVKLKTTIDWGTAFSTVVLFLDQRTLPSTLKEQELTTLENFVKAARRRLQEKSGG